MINRNVWDKKKWTLEEENILKQNYPQMTRMEIKELFFPDRTYFSVSKKIYAMNLYKPENPVTERVGYLDIESSQLQADFGIMYSWVIKEKGKKIYDMASITRKELLDGVLDKRIVEELIDALQKYNVIYTYYGSRFDTPFIRTRALMHGLDFIPRGQILHRDLYYLARRCLRLSSNRLANVTRVLGIPGKTNIEQKYWILANTGNPQAIKYIVEHNIADVEILEKVHQKLEPFEAKTRRWM